MKVNLLKAKLVEREMNVETLANLMHKDKATIYRKLNESEKFTIGEAMEIKKILNLTSKEASNIFLD